MSKSNTAENAILLLIFNNDTWAGIGDAGGLLKSVADGSLYVGLHTSSPGEAGDQTTNEANYTGYARQAVARTTGGWTVSTNSVTNAAQISFPQSTGGGTDNIQFWSIGSASSGSGILMYYGPFAAAPLLFTTTDSASSDTFVSDAHGLSDGETVVFSTAPGGTLPTGVTEGTIYYVITSTTDSFQVSTTSGGSAVALTADGAGRVHQITAKDIATNDTPIIAAGALTVNEH